MKQNVTKKKKVQAENFSSFMCLGFMEDVPPSVVLLCEELSVWTTKQAESKSNENLRRSIVESKRQYLSLMSSVVKVISLKKKT